MIAMRNADGSPREHAEMLPDIRADNEAMLADILPRVRANQKAQEERRDRVRGIIKRGLRAIEASDDEIAEVFELTGFGA